jgi:hypothetical protein
MQRNSDGSQKEWIIFEDVMDKLTVCNNEISGNEFDSKNVMKMKDLIIKSIMDLQQRKYVIYYRDIIYNDRKMQSFMNTRKNISIIKKIIMETIVTIIM